MSNDLNAQIQQIITGKKQCQFKLLGLSLLFNRMKSKYQLNPTEPELNQCVAEVHSFINKYEKILAEDISKIKN